MEAIAQRRLAELGALLGIIAALVFVGLQVRAQVEATRAATSQRIADAHREMTIWYATDPTFRTAVRAATEAGDVRQLDPASQHVIRVGWRAVFGHWAALHDQFLQGQLAEHVWRGVDLEIQEVQTALTMRWAWGSEGEKYSDDFQALMQLYINRISVDD